MTPTPCVSGTRMTWAERVHRAYEAWNRWQHVPGRFRMDRVLKESGVRDLIVEIDQLRDALGLLRGHVEMGSEGWQIINRVLSLEADA